MTGRYVQVAFDGQEVLAGGLGPYAKRSSAVIWLWTFPA